jgi:hypothetical protein
MTRERPLLIAVDDVQWSDERSLRWLVFVARRCDRVPIAIAVAHRPGEPEADGRLVTYLETQDGAASLRPEPLSERATVELAREVMGESVEPEFAAACRRASGGNPFLLGELLAELRASGVAPSAAAAPLALSVAPESITRATLLRLARAPAAALPLARALAVLEEAELREAAALAGLDHGAAAKAASALDRAGLLAAGPRLRFAHPLVRGAIYTEIDEPGRAELHRRAAAVLAGVRATPERVSAHVLASAPSGSAAAVSALRTALGAPTRMEPRGPRLATSAERWRSHRAMGLAPTSCSSSGGRRSGPASPTPSRISSTPSRWRAAEPLPRAHCASSGAGRC